MTTPADATADERAFEACLAGRPVPDGAGLAAFTDAIRASATVPGRPNAALAELLATGLLVPTQEPSRGTAGRPARTSRKRPRMLFSTLVAKFAAAGAVAKAAAGTGVVVVALTGTATSGVLTTPEEPAAVVESTTTAEPTTTTEPTTTSEPALTTEPTTTTEPALTTEPAPTDVTAPEPTEEPTPTAGPVTGEDAPVVEQVESGLTETQWSDGPVEGRSHGSWVSEGARQGWVDGGTVSREAQERNDQRRAERAAGGTTAVPVDEPAAEEPVEQVAEKPGNGNGNGKGNGKGSGGR